MELKGWRITENSSHVAAEEVCQMIERAKALEETGRYEEAAGALSHVWAGPGARPEVTGLEPSIAAELLLRAGTLTGWVGSAKQIEGAQEEAKNLIGEASALFASTGEQARAANASIDLAICYWREGALSEARVILKDVLDRAPDSADVTSRALLNMSVVEVSANRYRDALACLERARPIFDAKEDAVSKGRFHNQLALVLRNIGSDENRNDLLEAALIEYAAASGYFEQAGHSRYVARVANNVGHLLFRLGRYDEAIQHMDRARALLISFSDSGTVAQINEDRARVFLAMNRHLEAEISASAAVHTLARGDEHSLLVEALTTHGIALARLGRTFQARQQLEHAVEVAERAGDLEASARAYITMMEELSLTPAELIDTYIKADQLLERTQNLETIERLRRCARKVLKTVTSNTPALKFEDFLIGGTMEEEVLRFEGELIRRALEDAEGSVTTAARRLGTSHQTLIAIINSRQQQLQNFRKPVQRRRRSIIRKDLRTKKNRRRK